MHHKILDPVALLRERGHKATPGRVAMLVLLAKSKRPLSAPEIYEALDHALDKVTVYRALEALARGGIIHSVDLDHRHRHYELVGGEHHHHIVCRVCGMIENVEPCIKDFEETVLKRSRVFDSIQSHALEFFGTCVQCAK